MRFWLLIKVRPLYYITPHFSQQLPPTATPFLRFSAADPTDLDFSKFKKEIRRGEIQKMQKSGLAGRVSLWLANGGACARQQFSSK